MHIFSIYPKKSLAQSFQLFGRLLDTNLQTDSQAKFLNKK